MSNMSYMYKVICKFNIFLICFVTALVYEILYQKVFSELDRRENSMKQTQSKHNRTADLNSVMTAYYQNGLAEDDGFKDDSEDNSGWTEVVRGKSSKGTCTVKVSAGCMNMWYTLYM